MRAVAYLSFTLLLAAAAPAFGSDATPSPGVQAQADQVQTGQASTSQAPANAAAQPAAPPQTAAQQAAARAERRRNRSYARCNRAAFNRNLKGGARRRFLIRCRLGYERGIGQPGQAAPAATPVRKP